MASRFWFTTATSKLTLCPLICFTFSFVCSFASSSAYAAKDLQPHITFNKGKIEIVGAKSKTKNFIEGKGEGGGGDKRQRTAPVVPENAVNRSVLKTPTSSSNNVEDGELSESD